MVAYPALDYRRYHLHRAVDVDFRLVIARRRQGFGHLEPVASVLLPHDASAVNRAFNQARHPSEHRIDTTGAFEKAHVHAVRIVLVDEHADEAIPPKRIPYLERRIEPSGYKFSDAGPANSDDLACDRRNSWRAINKSDVAAMCGCCQSQQLPVGQMSAEHERGSAIFAQVAHAFCNCLIKKDAPGFRSLRIEIPQGCKMAIFGDNSTQIVPHAIEDRFGFLLFLFRKSDPELRPRRAMAPQSRSDFLQEPSEDRGSSVTIKAPDLPQEQNRNRAHATFDSAEPASPYDKADVLVGAGDARFQLLDERYVGLCAILDRPAGQYMRGAEIELFAPIGIELAGPVRPRRAPKAALIHFYAGNVAIRNSTLTAGPR